MFGVLLGVLLTNTFINRQKEARSLKPEQTGTTHAVDNQPLSEEDALVQHEKSVIRATMTAKPAVVSIQSQGIQIQRFRHPIYEMLYGLTARPQNAMGSGVIIHPDGIIITNSHVINPATGAIGESAKIMVELSDGQTFEAEVKYNLPAKDIAILSVKGSDLPYIELGSSEHLYQGQTVLAIGNPFGFSSGGEPTVTKGIISATKRRLKQNQTYFPNMLQTDASINVGNSGGALVDLSGRLVGINTAIFDQGGGSLGIGFAIPVDRIKHIIESVEQYGNANPPLSGIHVQPLTRSIAQALNFRGDFGVIISEVEDGTPGARAGFQSGDILTDVNDFPVTSYEEIRRIFRGAYPGEIFHMRIFRDGVYTDIDLELSEME